MEEADRHPNSRVRHSQVGSHFMSVIPSRRTFLGLLTSALAWCGISANADDKPKGGKKGGGPRRGESTYALPPELKEFSLLSLVLGRVTDRSVTVSALSRDPGEAYFEYGTSPGQYTHKSKPLTLAAGEPVESV